MDVEQYTVNKYHAFYSEINTFQKIIKAEWESQIRNASWLFSSIPTISLSRYIDPAGGFQIYHNDWQQLNSKLKMFFLYRQKKDNRVIHLRGYNYYCCDANMYKKSNRPTSSYLWNILENKWIDYKNHVEVIQCLNNKISFINFIGVISFLEWIFNDLSSMMWVCMKLQHQIKNDYQTILEKSINLLAKLIVDISYNSWKNNKTISAEQIYNDLNSIVNNNYIKIFLMEIKTVIEKVEIEIVRAVREGDQLWIILATGEKKFWPWYNFYFKPKVTLLNNAFGAINIGYLIKYQNEANLNIVVDNVYYSFHEAEMQRYHQGGNLHLQILKEINDESNIIIIDDSLFTAKTFFGIQKSLAHITDKVACLPLTFDVATIFNHPEEIGFDNMNAKVEKIEECVRFLGGNLTVARSYWVFKKRNKYNSFSYGEEYNKVINGSDILMSLLWRRYRKEIMGF